MAKSSTKRSAAASQAGPPPKKVRHSTASIKDVQKRSRPVTSLQNDPTPASDSDEEEVTGDVDPFDKGDSMQVDSGTFHKKDPHASSESHKAQRVLHEQRRASKLNSKLLMDSKRIWSLARKKNMQSSERRTHIRSLMDIIRGKVKDIVFKHDASRIVQTVVKYGGEKERNDVAVELKGSYKDLAQSKYSKFLVIKLIRLCPAHRASILMEFQSHVLRLLLHREASSVLADAFELYANAYERTILLRDFYGKEVALFSHVTANDEGKEQAKKGLKGILDGMELDRRQRILTSVKENLMTILNNPDKGAVTHAIVHRALWEYLVATNDCSDEVEREKRWREIFECCQDVLADMVHTKDGSRVVREFLARSSAKDRKNIVKVLKPHVVRMCTDDEAQLVLFTALDIIDDTKLTGKSIVQEITSNTHTMYTSPQGRRALLYLLVPRIKRHFLPSRISIIAETDAIRAKTTKKDNVLRADEVRLAASEGLLAFVEKMGGEASRGTSGSLLITEIMLYADGDKTAAVDVLLRLVSTPYPSEDATHPHLIDLPHTSRMYKTLLQGGHFSHASNSISSSPSFSASAFATAWMKIVGREVTLQMAKGDGAFVVAELCERILEQGSDEERSSLRAWFQEADIREIEESQAKGKKVLLEKLAHSNS